MKTEYDEYWDIPEEIKQELMIVASIFIARTGASIEEAQAFMAATVRIYIRWLEMQEKEKVH